MLPVSIGLSALFIGAVSLAGGRAESRAARVALGVLAVLALAARVTGRVG